MAEKRRLSIFEKYLTLRVLLCIGAGIVFGKLAPEVAVKVDAFTVYQVSIPSVRPGIGVLREKLLYEEEGIVYLYP